MDDDRRVAAWMRKRVRVGPGFLSIEPHLLDPEGTLEDDLEEFAMFARTLDRLDAS